MGVLTDYSKVDIGSSSSRFVIEKCRLNSVDDSDTEWSYVISIHSARKAGMRTRTTSELHERDMTSNCKETIPERDFLTCQVSLAR